MEAATGLATADTVFATKDTPATVAYFMAAVLYKVQLKSDKTADDTYDSSAYEYVRDEVATDASCVKFTIGGYCSTSADWSDYADEVITLSGLTADNTISSFSDVKVI